MWITALSRLYLTGSLSESISVIDSVFPTESHTQTICSLMWALRCQILVSMSPYGLWEDSAEGAWTHSHRPGSRWTCTCYHSTTYVHLQINELRCASRLCRLPVCLLRQQSSWGRQEDAPWLPASHLPTSSSSSPPHNYTPVPICLQCINSSSWNPVLIFIRSQNYQEARDDSDCQPGPASQPGRAHGWLAITLARHRNTDGESNAALNTAHWRLPDHLSSSQQDTSHHSGKRIFILNKWSLGGTGQLKRTRCTYASAGGVRHYRSIPAIHVTKHRQFPSVSENKEIRISDSLCFTYVTAKTKGELCSDWLVTLSGLAHTSRTSLATLLSPSFSSARFTLTNA